NIPFEEVVSNVMDNITLPEIVVFSIAIAELPGAVEGWLKDHYCHVKPASDVGATVFFPAGTVKVEILPRTSQERYEITLPDGARCREQQLRGMVEGKSILFPCKDPLVVGNDEPQKTGDEQCVQ
ncbi:MAG TPA: hypothetical protein VFB12_17300, partial [Ktedonobacteraceae bacterium]|nr:hypothetical protein [Ktedonobacteraceae bacterium]